MSELVWFLLGFVIATTVILLTDKPRMNRIFQNGYGCCRVEMLEWNLYRDESGEQHFVNVQPIEVIDAPIRRAGDRNGVAWNDTNHAESRIKQM